MPKKPKPAIPKPYPLPKITVPVFREENGFYTTKQRSYNVSQIKGKDTKPEKLLKKALWHTGLRYRSNKRNLPGKPNISLIKYRLVVFIDGSFWPGHDWENRKEAIQSNREFVFPKSKEIDSGMPRSTISTAPEVGPSSDSGILR